MPAGAAAVATVIAASAYEQTIQEALDGIVYQRSLLSYETRHMRVEDETTDNGVEQVLVIRIKGPSGEMAKPYKPPKRAAAPSSIHGLESASMLTALVAILVRRSIALLESIT